VNRTRQSDRVASGASPLERFRTFHAVMALAMLVTIAYWNSLRNDFVFDDRAVILENRLIAHLANLPVIMASGYWAGAGDDEGLIRYFDVLYRPLVIVTYALNYAVGGRSPVGFHLVNVGLHLLVTCLLYALARQLRLSREAAFLSAALFALHPLHTEAVTYVVGRAEL